MAQKIGKTPNKDRRQNRKNVFAEITTRYLVKQNYPNKQNKPTKQKTTRKSST